MRALTPHRSVAGRGRTRSVAAGVAVTLTAVLALAGCGGSDDDTTGAGETPTSAEGATPTPGPASAAAALEEGATVIDVRTPEEFAAGHVEGALLVDVQSEDFDDRVAELDPAATYVVYCRSGNRSAQAAGRMAAAGLTVLDGGALDDMVAAGWPESAG